MSTFIICILILLLGGAGFALYNMTRKFEAIEDKYLQLYNSFCYIRDNFEIGYKTIVQADTKGAFANDDEVGTIFTIIKDTTEDLKKLTEIDITDGSGEKKKG